jgi:predicted outer membrane repeat protein
VAQGLYKPDQGGGKTPGDRNASFQLISDVTILGGYAGLDAKDPNTGAIVDRNTREPKLFFTVLSGDLKGDDKEFSDPWGFVTDPKRDENSEHVVVAIGAGVIDGCAITAGNSKSLAYDDGGAGIYCTASAVSPVFSSCMIGQNKAAKNGGGILVKGKSPQIINCEFNYNYADCGGAIALWQTAAVVKGSTIIADNRARLGGGCYIQEGTPNIENCEITYSYAEERGGGCFINNSTLSIETCHVSDNSAKENGGGICCSGSTTNLEGCEIARNSAKLGAGCYFYSGGNVILEFCSLTENKASQEGGAIYALSGTLTLSDVVAKDNSAKDNGGGICCWGSTTNLERCEIARNSAKVGAGCYFYSDSNSTLQSCTLTENEARSGSVSGSLTLDKVVANNNAAGFGGAISCSQTQVNLVQSRFCGNRAKNGNGGALYAQSLGLWDVTNCVCAGNYASNLGGVICCLNYTKVKNSIFWDNVAKAGSQIALIVNSRLDVDYCDVQGGKAAVYKESATLLGWGEGNIEDDPCFVAPGYWGSKLDPNVPVEPNKPDAVWVDGDYHLRADSPCIDKGDPKGDYSGQTDIDDRCRVVRSAIDMGVDEQDCFPANYSTYNDWIALGSPDCWCAPTCGSGYQCDGDADGVRSPYPGLYRCFIGDLNLIVDNWKRPPDHPKFNPCADIDHKAQGIPKYRVFTNDLARLVACWKKRDAELPGNSPRPE